MMDDDPWGSTTDPWGTPAIDVIGIRDDAPVKQADTQSPPTHTSSLPVPPAVGNFAEVDPWASPAVSVRTQEKTPSPIPDIHSTLSSGTPQVSDSPLPPQWTSQGSLEGDTWRTTEAVPTAPASGLAIQLSPEQIPLPGTDNEESDLEHPAEEKPSGPSGAVWKASDEQDNQLDVPDLPTLSEPPRPLVVEDETFNPFSQSEGPSDPIPGNSTEGFAPSSFDDDAFGGFTAGGFQDRAEFAGIEYGDGSQGWGNPEGSSNIPSADGAWGVESDANNLANEDDDEGGFQSSSATYGSTIKVANVNEEDGFHSIPAKEKEVVPSEKLKHDEWEAARRDIELREARAPAEVVNKLVSQWKDVLEQIFPLSDSTDLGKDVEDGMDLETTIRRDRYVTA
ncbi:hypothetical protein QFC19_003945 [Naganishia cerealis]|uniref:Uncharacterized protein n=1 Tax=Naganishia cerealis TaxID=610337 RepID=A0ACC2W0P3_9TREE|nr:hypothetical protein QFC19_003945 [Naganishia cerealis]